MRRFAWISFAFVLFLCSCGDDSSVANSAPYENSDVVSLGFDTSEESSSSVAENPILTESSAESAMESSASLDSSETTTSEDLSSAIIAQSSAATGSSFVNEDLSSSSATQSSSESDASIVGSSSSEAFLSSESLSHSEESSSSEVSSSSVTDAENTAWLVCDTEGTIVIGLIDSTQQYYCKMNGSEGKWYNLENSFSVLPTEVYINKSFAYGTLTDTRDGHVYRTTTIGNQTWMAENLNFFESSDVTLTANLSGQTECPSSSTAYCQKYGRLYSWSAAMNLSSDYLEKNPYEGDIWFEHQGVCPDGWHLPSSSDWNELTSYVANAENAKVATPYLTAARGWKNGGEDKYGFTLFATENNYGSPETWFWTSNIVKTISTGGYFYKDGSTYGLVFNFSGDATSSSNKVKDNKYSVRCVQDREPEAENLKNDPTDLYSQTLAESSIFGSSATYGTMTDERDGQIYRTVVIGSQEWMAENLNYRTFAGSSCYGNNLANCDVYGRLYSAKAMVTRQSSSFHDVCPVGWHVPSSTEWNTLASYVSSNTSTPVGTALKSSVGFLCRQTASICGTSAPDGTNEFGFSAIGSSQRIGASAFADDGAAAYYWMSDYEVTLLTGAKVEQYKELLYRTETLDVDTMSVGLTANVSVRCVKD